MDLLIWSHAPLSALLEDLGDRVSINYHGSDGEFPHYLILECTGKATSPDEVVAALCDAIDGLSPASRGTWNDAVCVFDFGYEHLARHKLSTADISSESVSRISGLGGSVRVTFYRDDRHTASTETAGSTGTDTDR